MPENTETTSRQASSGPSSGPASRTAAEIFEDFMAMSAAAVAATEATDWTYEDGSAWDPAAPDIVFHPQRCADSKDGRDTRDLQLALEAPAPEVPREARDRMRTYLEGSGFTLRSVIDAPAGESTLPYSVAAAREDGALVVYAANGIGAFLTLESECSDHPSLENDVSAETS